jgi:hydroxylamine reductase (hybrid-cluster protein)
MEENNINMETVEQTESVEVKQEEVQQTQDEAIKNQDKKSEKSKKKEQEPQFDLSAFLPDTIEEIIQLNILQMREWSYIYMGLIPHPKHKKIVSDMRQAKIAIDTATAMLDIVMPHLDEKLQREFKVIISDLKMNFISRSN